MEGLLFVGSLLMLLFQGYQLDILFVGSLLMLLFQGYQLDIVLSGLLSKFGVRDS